MQITIDPKPAIPAGPQLHFLGGHFAISSTRIPYVTVHMSVSQVASCLNTPIELPGWDDSEAELEALYQRQLDYKRVKTKILPYLTDSSERPRFFNAITVALVPYAERSIQSFEGRTYHPPQLENSGARHHLEVGPIKLGFYTQFDAAEPHTYVAGEIRWNPDEVAAVAIDGQHRLAALKQLHKIDPSREHDTKVAVILVIPSAALGFSAVVQNGSLLRLLRSIFIDLNKHAKPVKRSRLILLDDTDPQSVIVRRILGEKLRSVKAESPLDTGRLPLALVDWHRDDAKFDTGPYVTSVLMLDRAVELLLGVKGSAMSASVLAKQVQAFRRFGYAPTEECEKRLEAYKDAEEEWQDPFSYPVEDLERLRDTVGIELSSVIGHALTTIAPYRELIAMRNEVRALESSFSTWFEALSARDGTPESEGRLVAVITRIQSEAKPPKIDAWDELVTGSSGGLVALKEDALFFKVVFQGAYFAALRKLWDEPLIALHDDSSTCDTGTIAHLRRWNSTMIAVVNALLGQQPRFFDLKYAFGDKSDHQVLFWAGSALSVTKDSVDYAASAQDRIREWLFLMAMAGDAVFAWKASGGKALPANWDEFGERLVSVDEDFAKRIAISADWIKHGNTGNRGSMLRIADAMTDSSEESYKRRKASDQFDKRVNHLWALIRKVEVV